MDQDPLGGTTLDNERTLTRKRYRVKKPLFFILFGTAYFLGKIESSLFDPFLDGRDEKATMAGSSSNGTETVVKPFLSTFLSVAGMREAQIPFFLLMFAGKLVRQIAH
jgi:hypothetical protein